MSDEEFLRLTPRQFYLMLDHYRERIEYQEFIAGQIAANIVNWGFRTPKKPVTPFTFMPSRSKPKAKRAPRINRKKIAHQVRAFFDTPWT